MDTNELFAQRLINLRKEKGITQEKLAELSNLSRQYISKLETGNASPTLDTLKALAMALNVSTCDLIKNI